MKTLAYLPIVCALLLAPAAQGTDAASSVIVDRAEDTGFIRVEVKSFASLNARQQQLAYWLTQAAIATDPIAYDQFSRYGLRQKRLLEGTVAHTPAAKYEKIRTFAKLFWANRGNHNETTSQKILPSFSFEELRTAAHEAQHSGAFAAAHGDLPPLKDGAALDRELTQLRASFFDPQFEPMLTAKSPGPGQDLIQASSNTFYEGLSETDLKDFKDRYPLNSRLVKGKDGALMEQVYRAGTPDGKVPPGLYALYLRRAIVCLGKAQQVADPAQAKVIGDLIRFYQTGDFADWVQFGTDWVQNDATVDFEDGFVEIYRDARGAKGSSQAFVSITDAPTTTLLSRLAANAEYFEQRAPWDTKYKKQSIKLPLVKAIETLVETGDFGVTIIGDNLPNENQIHEKYGTKNFLFMSSSRALNAASGHTVVAEFAASPEIVDRDLKYGEEAGNLLTALHEVIGHGSGQLSERLKGGAEPYLKEYFSTLEEARADLMGLWNVWDPKLKELGLISDQEEVAKAMYDRAVMAPLLQLRSIRHGDTVEEDHQRDRQLIVNFIRAQIPDAIEQFDREGKTYVRIRDYQKVHQGVGILLAELMRIKAEGDYTAIKLLIDKHAVHFDTALRDQVVARFQKLGLPTYWAGINAQLSARTGKDGAVETVQLSYPSSTEQQYLSYGAMFDRSLRTATGTMQP
ncbi:MAG: putative dipeptidyl-peptidase [Gammaproteobacteria bacterium]|nr:putative dipeptidyl-peptidase [Gammaproteobacteria bacterium]